MTNFKSLFFCIDSFCPSVHSSHNNYIKIVGIKKKKKTCALPVSSSRKWDECNNPRLPGFSQLCKTRFQPHLSIQPPESQKILQTPPPGSLPAQTVSASEHGPQPNRHYQTPLCPARSPLEIPLALRVFSPLLPLVGFCFVLLISTSYSYFDSQSFFSFSLAWRVTAQ